MRTLHMLHTLDVNVGEITSTVRNGFKWADLKTPEPGALGGEYIELCVCGFVDPTGGFIPDPDRHNVVGLGEVVGLWFGKFQDIPARFLRNEHEVQSRTYNGLLDSMERAYGRGYSEESPVTVVVYKRIR